MCFSKKLVGFRKNILRLLFSKFFFPASYNNHWNNNPRSKQQSRYWTDHIILYLTTLRILMIVCAIIQINNLDTMDFAGLVNYIALANYIVIRTSAQERPNYEPMTHKYFLFRSQFELLSLQDLYLVVRKIIWYIVICSCEYFMLHVHYKQANTSLPRQCPFWKSQPRGNPVETCELKIWIYIANREWNNALRNKKSCWRT